MTHDCVKHLTILYNDYIIMSWLWKQFFRWSCWLY